MHYFLEATKDSSVHRYSWSLTFYRCVLLLNSDALFRVRLEWRADERLFGMTQYSVVLVHGLPLALSFKQRLKKEICICDFSVTMLTLNEVITI